MFSGNETASSCVRRLIARLTRVAGDAAIVDAQNPLPLEEFSEPQPDVVLLRPRPDFYRDAHPRPSDALLVIEVAETSAEYDRTIKAPLYASAGVGELWIVDLPGRIVDVCREPAGGSYTEHVVARPGTSIALPGVHGERMAMDDILA